MRAHGWSSTRRAGTGTARALGIQAAPERGAGDVGAGARAERAQARVRARRGSACRTKRVGGALARRFGVG
jgi:hypothetical protein